MSTQHVSSRRSVAFLRLPDLANEGESPLDGRGGAAEEMAQLRVRVPLHLPQGDLSQLVVAQGVEQTEELVGQLGLDSGADVAAGAGALP